MNAEPDSRVRNARTVRQHVGVHFAICVEQRDLDGQDGYLQARSSQPTTAYPQSPACRVLCCKKVGRTVTAAPSMTHIGGWAGTVVECTEEEGARGYAGGASRGGTLRGKEHDVASLHPPKPPAEDQTIPAIPRVTSKHACAHTRTHTHTHAHTRTRTHGHTRAHTGTRAHGHTGTRAHGHTLTHPHAHAHTHHHNPTSAR
jgi:hypothetical protein